MSRQLQHILFISTVYTGWSGLIIWSTQVIVQGTSTLRPETWLHEATTEQIIISYCLGIKNGYQNTHVGMRLDNLLTLLEPIVGSRVNVVGRANEIVYNKIELSLHNIIQSHNNVLRDWQYFAEYCSHSYCIHNDVWSLVNLSLKTWIQLHDNVFYS
jgi:hypothetical protein